MDFVGKNSSRRSRLSKKIRKNGATKDTKNQRGIEAFCPPNLPEI